MWEEGRGGHPCKEKEKAEYIENCEGFGDGYARLVDEFKGINRRQTTGEVQEDRTGTRIRLKKREQETKKPKNLYR